MTLPSYAMSQASFPELYERHLVGPLFKPWAEVLLERAALANGDRVLDVACGTGIVARLAKARLGPHSRVVGVDLSAPMIAVASEREPAVDWRVGDAAALPITGDERFDVIVCQQGLQFFADRPAGAREMRRALAPGGRAIVSTWRPLEEHALLRELQAAAERFVGPFIDQRHSFGESAALTRLLESAGFRDVRTETVERALTFDDPRLFLQMNTMAIVGMSGAGAGAPDADRARLVEIVMRECEPIAARYTKEGRLSLVTASNVAVARAS